MTLYLPDQGTAAVQESSYRWATVTSTDPLLIRLDGDTVPLPVTPDSLLDITRLTAGDRVWVQLVGRRLVVLGKAGGLALPAPPPEPGIWQDYSAQIISDNTGTTTGTSISFARYMVLGNTCFVIGEGSVGTTAISNVAATLPPPTPSRRFLNCGSFNIHATSAPAQSGAAAMTSTLLRVVTTPLTSSAFVDAPASSTIRWNLVYEIA
jgi:hypothetical protein